jgi:hypothetical protein
MHTTSDQIAKEKLTLSADPTSNTSHDRPAAGAEGLGVPFTRRRTSLPCACGCTSIGWSNRFYRDQYSGLQTKAAIEHSARDRTVNRRCNGLEANRQEGRRDERRGEAAGSGLTNFVSPFFRFGHLQIVVRQFITVPSVLRRIPSFGSSFTRMGCGQSTAASTEPTLAVQPQEPTTKTTSETQKPAPAESSQPTQSSTVDSSQAASSTTLAPSSTTTQHRPSTIDRTLDDAAQLEHKLRNNMSAAQTNTIPNDPAAASDAPPAWKSFTPEQLAAIEEARAAVRAKGPLVMDPKGTYGLICRACTKPNSTNVTFCTGCSFPSTVEDVQRLPDNIFVRDTPCDK